LVQHDANDHHFFEAWCLLYCCLLQVREEAGELCQTLEANEGKERAASEMADLLYHSMVLLNVQVGTVTFFRTGLKFALQ
jgi:phosphoribosyl-ATP pyrophosphohydrolase